MKSRRCRHALILAAAIAGLGAMATDAHAQLAWDPNQTPATPSGGTGIWDTSTLNWSNGTTDTTWITGPATFSAPGGVVTLAAPISATAINLNAAGYTFASSGSPNILSLSGGIITQSAGVTGINEFAGPINLSSSTVNINGGTLRLSNTLAGSGNSITGTTFNVASGSTLEFSAVTGASALGNGAIALSGGTLQIDPTAVGTAGSYIARFVPVTSPSTEFTDFYANPLSGSPTALSGAINFNPGNPQPPVPFYPSGPLIDFGARFSGDLIITNGGQYTFSTTSDDGSRLYIDNKLVVLNDGAHVAQTITSAPITLGSGLHEFRLDYTQLTGDASLALRYSGPDSGNSSILIPGSAMQTLDTISQSNNISLTRDSAIHVVGSNYAEVGMGNLTFNLASGGSATLAVDGDPGRSLHLAGTNLTAGTTDIFNTATDVFVGKLTVSGTGTGPTIVKTGSGRLFFDYTAATNNLPSTSTIDVREGTAVILTGGVSTTGFNDPIGSAVLQINGGTVDIDAKNGSPNIQNNIVVTGAGGILEADAAFTNFNNSLKLNGNLNVATTAGSPIPGTSLLRLAAITGTGNLTKIASIDTGNTVNLGTLEFANSSPNWTGSLILNANAGTVQGDFSAATDKPFGTNQIILHGGTLALLRNSGSPILPTQYTPGNNLSADASFTIALGTNPGQNFAGFQLGQLALTGGSQIINQTGDLSTAAAFSGTSLGGDTTFNVSSLLTLGGISETAPSSLTKTGGGTLVVSGSSSYSGSTNIQTGALRVVGSNALPTAGALNIAQGTLDLNGFDQTVASLMSSSIAPIVAGIITNSAPGVSTLTVQGISNFGGSINDGGPGKSVALSLNGGTLSVSGLNRYSGGTVINPGATLVSALSYENGGTLGTGPISLAGGRLALQGQQQVSPAGQQSGLRVDIYNTTPIAVNSSDPNFATLTSLTTHLNSMTPLISVQSTTSGKNNFDFSNATVSNGTVTGTYTTQLMFNTPPSASNNTTADYGFYSDGGYQVRFSGYINVPQAGLATFSSTSDDGSVIWLDNLDTPVVSNNGFQAATTHSSSYNFATAGLHPITIGYYQAFAGQGLQVNWMPPGSDSMHTLLSSETITGNLVTAPVQTYTNNLVVTADSTIDVSGSPQAVMGNLSIANKLSLTSSDNTANAYGLTLANVTLTGNSTFDVANSAGGGAGKLTLGPISNPGAFAITKSGAGTLVLTGSNSSSGQTSVLGGSLDVGGSVNTAGVSVAGGAVLGGKGAILSGNVAIHSNATLAPTLNNRRPFSAFTVDGNLSFDDSTATLGLNLASSVPGSNNYDQVLFASAVTLNGVTLLLNDGVSSLPAVQKFWILDGLSGSSPVSGFVSYQGQFLSDGSIFTDSAGRQYLVNYNAAGDPNATGNDVLLTTVPEPTTFALLALGASGLLMRRRGRPNSSNDLLNR